jgi:hypothetical protein
MKFVDKDGIIVGYNSEKLISLPKEEPAKIELKFPYDADTQGSIYSMTCSNEFTGAS